MHTCPDCNGTEVETISGDMCHCIGANMTSPDHPYGVTPANLHFEREGNKAVYDVTITVSVVATCQESAMLIVGDECSRVGDVEKISAEWIEEV